MRGVGLFDSISEKDSLSNANTSPELDLLFKWPKIRTNLLINLLSGHVMDISQPTIIQSQGFTEFFSGSKNLTDIVTSAKWPFVYLTKYLYNLKTDLPYVSLLPESFISGDISFNFRLKMRIVFQSGQLLHLI